MLLICVGRDRSADPPRPKARRPRSVPGTQPVVLYTGGRWSDWLSRQPGAPARLRGDVCAPGRIPVRGPSEPEANQFRRLIVRNERHADLYRVVLFLAAAVI